MGTKWKASSRDTFKESTDSKDRIPESTLSRRNFVKGAGFLAAGAAMASGAALSACAPGGSGTGSGSGSGTGTFVGVGNGRGGALVAEVTLTDGNIDAVNIIASKESYHVGSVVVEAVPKLIVDNQSTAIDIVSGATITSMAITTAVNDALSKAGLDAQDYATPVSAAAPSQETTADIVVVGSGGAGLSAAIRAAEAGKNVVLLEKMGIVGGTSNFSIESYGSFNDATHKALGSPATLDSLLATYIQQNPNGKEEAFRTYLTNCGQEADWLRKIGCEFTVSGAQNSISGSREVGDFGATLSATLHAEALKQGVDIRLNSAAQEIVMDGDAVAGVVVSTEQGEYTLNAKAVILTTGGFAANQEMVGENNPLFGDLDYSCGKGSTGDGHTMAQTVGAELVDMDYIRVNFTYSTAPTGFFYYLGCIFNTGAIFVNENGERYVNDQGGYGVGPTIKEQGGGEGWGIFDSSIMTGSADVRHYGDLGLYTKADTIEDLAAAIGVDAAGLSATIEKYKGFVAAGADADFKRPMINMAFDEPPYYACKVNCRAQGTFGGIKSTVNTEVQNAAGDIIPGLYSAGECSVVGTWGIHPASVNVVFGSIAGRNAASYIG